MLHFNKVFNASDMRNSLDDTQQAISFMAGLFIRFKPTTEHLLLFQTCICDCLHVVTLEKLFLMRCNDGIVPIPAHFISTAITAARIDMQVTIVTLRRKAFSF